MHQAASQGASLKKRCSIKGADLAQYLEVAASERPMGGQVEQLAEAVITNEAEDSRDAEED